jgi:hypothetical protein
MMIAEDEHSEMTRSLRLPVLPLCGYTLLKTYTSLGVNGFSAELTGNTNCD